MANDLFVGTWKLDPTQSDYQIGTPPQTGTYRLEAQSNGYLVIMDWTDAQGKTFYASYTALPDGVQYPYENADVADFISMTRLDGHNLDTAIYKNGRRIAYSLRTLSDDGQLMMITQSGFTPDGSPFDNRSVYVRQA